MKHIELLILFYLARLSICNDLLPVTTAHLPCSCGRIKLTNIKKCYWPFCSYWPWGHKLHFYDLATTNDTITTADNIECNICRLNPYGKESCTSQPCDELQFDCVWTNHRRNSVPSPTRTIPSQVTYPTTTNYYIILPQKAGQIRHGTSILALGTIIGLLSILVVLLIVGWIWTCWIMKKRAKTLSRSNGTGLSQHSNGYSTPHLHYENNIMNKDTKFESSANYSLLIPENRTNSGTDGGKAAKGGDEEYCMLDRSCGKTKTTAHQQREQLDGYSRLFSN